jgi:predicted RNA-binding Zn-ribbon protein involved in translation (DUF1610 family)
VTPCGTVFTNDFLIGHPCPDCGHTNIAHPGSMNPRLRSCVICEMLMVIHEEP